MGDREKLEALTRLGRSRVARLRRLDKEGRLEAPFGAEPTRVLEGPVSGDQPSYFYRPNELLTTEAALERVEDGLRRIGLQEWERWFPREGSGYVRLKLVPGAGSREVDVPATLRRLREQLDEPPSPTPSFSPNHVLHPAPWNTAGPATEPDLPSGDVLRAVDQEAGRGVTVAIIDTGLIDEPRDPSLVDDISLGNDPFEDVDYDGDTYIDPVAGHGTFIAALIRQVAPATTLHVEHMNDKAGIFAESDVAERLHAVLDLQPDLINLSLGGHTDLSAAPVALERVWTRLEAEGKTVVVAAAGNTASTEPFWPAASDFAVGVGAIGVDGRRAWFSNHGPWVDVWAPGEDLLSAYAHGTYRPLEPQRRPPFPVSDRLLDAGRRLGRALPERLGEPVLRLRRLGLLEFDGRATWSGTSFATPLVVGAIAALMSSQGISARAAKERLLATALPVIDLAAYGTR